MDINAEINKVRNELTALRTERLELSRLETSDDADYADKTQQLTVIIGKTNLKDARLVRLIAAKKRIVSGDYGVCEACFEDIEQARLDRDIAAEHCAACAVMAATKSKQFRLN